MTDAYIRAVLDSFTVRQKRQFLELLNERLQREKNLSPKKTRKKTPRPRFFSAC